MLNKVMIIGRLGRDPELRYSQSGSPVCTLNIATDESYTDRDGNRVDRAEWHRVVVFQKAAENCSQYLTKGSLVFVEGSLQTRKWQDQQGQDRYTTEINAQRRGRQRRRLQRSPPSCGGSAGRRQPSPAAPAAAAGRLRRSGPGVSFRGQRHGRRAVLEKYGEGKGELFSRKVPSSLPRAPSPFQDVYVLVLGKGGGLFLSHEKIPYTQGLRKGCSLNIRFLFPLRNSWERKGGESFIRKAFLPLSNLH